MIVLEKVESEFSVQNTIHTDPSEVQGANLRNLSQISELNSAFEIIKLLR